MYSKFTERDTEAYYDTEDALYRSFWDEEGSLHWGYFDEHTGSDFLKAAANTNEVMLAKAGPDGSSRVLDLGCGNGNTAVWLSQRCGCDVTGVDLSGVRISNAQQAADAQPVEVRQRLRFQRASATSLPFDDGAFTHVWSQATIYHVHDKRSALREAYRVLEPGGVFTLDDLLKPKPQVSEAAQTYVYDRLLFNTDFSFASYQETLKEIGFSVIEAHDLSSHLAQSYQCLAALTEAKSRTAGDEFDKLTIAL